MVKLLRPSKKRINEFHDFFRAIIFAAFKANGFEEDDHIAIEDEVKSKIDKLNRDFSSSGEEVYFLFAEIKGKIIGCFAIDQPSPIITENVDIACIGIPEISSVLILPEYQKLGLGSLFFNLSLLLMKQKGYSHFFLDCGYQTAQPYWRAKLGEPEFPLYDFWGPGGDHFIWYKKLDDFTPVFPVKE